MKTATIMTRDDRVLCVEMYDSETGICEIFNESDAAEIFDSETVYVWGNGSFFEKCQKFSSFLSKLQMALKHAQELQFQWFFDRNVANFT